MEADIAYDQRNSKVEKTIKRRSRTNYLGEPIFGEIDLLQTEEEKERDALFQNALEIGTITRWQFVNLTVSELLTLIEGYESNHRISEDVNHGLTRSGYESNGERYNNGIRILELLIEPGQTYSQKNISEKLGITRQAVANNIKKMESKGLVKTRNMGVFKCYEITNKGREYCYDHDVNLIHRGMKPMV